LTPGTRLTEVKPETAIDRVKYCKTLLSLHGFLSKPESEAVQRRIKNWIKSGKSTFPESN